MKYEIKSQISLIILIGMSEARASLSFSKANSLEW